MVSRFPRFALIPLLITALAACSDDPVVEMDDDEVDEVTDDETSDDTGFDDDADDTASDDSDDSAKVDAGKADAGNTQVKPDSGTNSKADAGNSDAATSNAGKDGAADADKSDGGSEPVESGDKLKPKCMKKDSQLIVIGDSYINWPITHSFPDDMIEESGQKWRMEAVGGYSMATGGTGLIPPLFDAAIKRDPDAHTVLMDGGGNDILLGDTLRECRDEKAPMVATCTKIVADAIAASEKLMERMATAGIRDVVYFFYPHIPENTVLGGPNPNHVLDYALPLVRDFCESREAASGGKLRCTFIDMVPVFEGKPQGEWFFPGDIHPTSVGSKAMANEVWRVMTDKCIGQKDPKDCCES